MTFAYRSVIIMVCKGSDPVEKMGRPTDAPKRVQIAIRFDEKTLAIPGRFCERKGNSRAEGVRRAVARLERGVNGLFCFGKPIKVSLFPLNVLHMS